MLLSAAGLWYFAISAICQAAFDTARASAQALRDRAKSDDEKEQLARRAAVEMLRYAWDISVRVLFSLAAPAAVLSAALYWEWSDLTTLMSAAVSLPVIGLGVLLFAYALIPRR